MGPGLATTALRATILIATLSLAACQAALSPGDGAGASASGAAWLAEIRQANGLPALAVDRRLEQAALRQSGYMAASGKMAHATGWRRDFSTRMRQDGIDGIAAENLARGRMEMDEVFARWMASPPHRRNMLDPRVKRFGLAYARAGRGGTERYWTLVVGD